MPPQKGWQDPAWLARLDVIFANPAPMAVL